MSDNNGNASQESWFEVASDKLSAKIKLFFLRNKWKFLLLAFIGLMVLFLLRANFQPTLLSLREYSFVCLAIMLYALFLLIFKARILPIKLVILSLLVVFSLTLFTLSGAQQYIVSYLRYQSLNIVELNKLPTTTKERVQPLDSIYVQASEKINETESVSIPDLILKNNEQKWVLEIFPTYLGQKLIKGRIEEIFVISATQSTPDFSVREKVNFLTGENLLFSKNARTNAIKSLNILQYFNHFPTDVKVVPDGKGGWVQVVALAKFKGISFPHLEFAGVHVIPQSPAKNSSIFDFFKRVLFGLGEFIPAERIAKHKYLKNQNIIPYICTRKIAETFKFQKGFFSPVRTYHEGDIRIPKMLGNNTEMPYVLLFNGVEKNSGLYHYFGLEPFDEQKHGLSLSVFISSDGIDDNIYIYDHSKKKESLTGASAIATKVMESKKNYDWSTNQPVENRPYIKDINGERRLFWLTTVATVNDEGGLAGSLPEIVITDAATNLPIWVDSKNQSVWLDNIQLQLSHLKDH